jgi:hypothetical protein
VTAARRLRLEALVAPGERGAVQRGAALLAHALSAADRTEWAVEYAYPATRADMAPGPAAVVASLLGEVGRFEEDWGACEARLRETYRRLCSDPARPVYLFTVLRHVPAAVPRRMEILVRIRRLNLLAALLSHELGLLVVDIDRDLADIGARTLATDFRLGGPAAARAAAKSLAMTLLLAGLDETVPFALQEAARGLIRPLQALPAVSAHRRRGFIGPSGRQIRAGRVSQVAMG